MADDSKRYVLFAELFDCKLDEIALNDSDPGIAKALAERLSTRTGIRYEVRPMPTAIGWLSRNECGWIKTYSDRYICAYRCTKPHGHEGAHNEETRVL